MRPKITSFVASLLGLVAMMVGGIASTASPAGAIANNGKVLVIVLENKGYSQAIAGLPTLWNYSQLYAYFTNFHAIRHPSEPNYLAIAGGSTFGDTTDHSDADDFPVNSVSVFGQAFAARNGSWQGSARSYMEGMVDNCDLTAGGSGTVHYEVKHNPQAFFTKTSPQNERNICRLTNVAAGSYQSGNLHNDVVNGNLPNVGFLIPNNCNNGHAPCDFGDTEPWLAHMLPFLTSGPDFENGKLTIVVIFDEDEGEENNRILTTVIANATAGKGAVNTSGINHYSLSGFLSDATGSTHLNNAAMAPNMRAALGLPAPK